MPAPLLVNVPVLVVIASDTVTLPAPVKVKFCVPVIASPLDTSKVNVPDVLPIVVAPAKVTKPLIVLLPDVFKIAPVPPPDPVTPIASAIVMPPDNDNCAPSEMVTPPAEVPSALLFEAANTPFDTVIAPV